MRFIVGSVFQLRHGKRLARRAPKPL